jgi:acylphosphatase
MVMYRDFAQRKARGLGVVGTVRNCSDGSVEVVAQGTRELLERYLGYLKRGSLLSHVKEVSVEWSSVTIPLTDFKIIY